MPSRCVLTWSIPAEWGEAAALTSQNTIELEREISQSSDFFHFYCLEALSLACSVTCKSLFEKENKKTFDTSAWGSKCLAKRSYWKTIASTK